MNNEHTAEQADDVNVEALMREIRARVEEKKRLGIYRDDMFFTPPGLAGRNPSVSPDTTNTDQRLQALRETARLDLRGPDITSHRPLAGTVIVAVKKSLRYWIRKYTDSLFLRQSYFNSEIVNEVERLHREVKELKQQLRERKSG